MSTMPEPRWTHMEPLQSHPCHLLCQVSLGRWRWWRGPAHLHDSEGGACASSQQMKPSGAVSQNNVVARVSLH